MHEVVSPDSPSPSLTQENEAIPDHYFEVNVIKGKTGAMKGKTRETVSLLIGNHIFRKKNTLKDGTIRFSCNGCEKLKPAKYLSAFASINENGNYELQEWPHSEDHRCWVDGTEALVRQARQEMFKKVDQDPSRSINKIYEEVRVSFTGNLDEDEKLLFLQKFPPLRNIAPHLYARRRDHIPADPKTQEEFDVYLEMFNYEEGKGVCIGDIKLSDGRRVLLFSSDTHLKILARAGQILQDATFKITPSCNIY